MEIPVVPVGKSSFGEKFLRRNGSFRKSPWEDMVIYLFLGTQTTDSDVTKGDGYDRTNITGYSVKMG